MTEQQQEALREDFEMPRWELPGWDWEPGDYSWLASQSGIRLGDTSIFFIHGGRIRHQAHIPDGNYTVDEFCAMVREKAAGLDDPYVRLMYDVGDGTPSIWVEGTRPPAQDDLLRLQHARDLQRQQDERELRALRSRRPELFTDQA